jgi:hypothetical protein
LSSAAARWPAASAAVINGCAACVCASMLPCDPGLLSFMNRSSMLSCVYTGGCWYK